MGSSKNLAKAEGNRDNAAPPKPVAGVDGGGLGGVDSAVGGGDSVGAVQVFGRDFIFGHDSSRRGSVATYSLSTFAFVLLGIIALGVVGGIILKSTQRDGSAKGRTRALVILGAVVVALGALGLTIALMDPPPSTEFWVEIDTDAKIYWGRVAAPAHPNAISQRFLLDRDAFDAIRLDAGNTEAQLMSYFERQGIAATYERIAYQPIEFGEGSCSYELAKVVLDRNGTPDPVAFVVVREPGYVAAHPFRFDFAAPSGVEIREPRISTRSGSEGNGPLRTEYVHHELKFVAAPEGSTPTWVSTQQGQLNLPRR